NPGNGHDRSEVAHDSGQRRWHAHSQGWHHHGELSMTAPRPMVAADPLASVPQNMRWIVSRALPEADAVAAIGAQDSPEQVVSTWVDNAHVTSAIRLLAHALPIREAVWWGWVSARYASQLANAPVPTAEVQAALAAIEQWI